MKKKLFSLIIAAVMCLSIAAPVFAADDEYLTRIDLAVLFSKYGNPKDFDKGGGAVLTDTGGLSKEEKDAATAVVRAGWMRTLFADASSVNNFQPDLELTYWQAASYICNALDPERASSSAPKLPPSGEPSANYDAAYEKWADQMRPRFGDAPESAYEALEIVSGKGIIDVTKINSWYDFADKKTAEEWVKAAFGHKTASSDNTAKPVSPAASLKFSDVSERDYFAVPVSWAIEKNITSGTSKTTFSPSKTCSRAQILTFLWRANGSPEPKAANPFTDIKPSDYYYKAALWASENGLVSGSVFGGSTDCTRSMTVEYIWKAAGSPDASKQAAFNDVFSNDGYAKAVAWAVENEITSGTENGNFSPAATCTRGQIVTFLHRAMN